ncbi:hypothetical protein [Pedobacter sp. MR22-3]|uniref:hypothetical protein n=1 Tax=Pedobacter TaxID=84567 RepID=UPI0022480B38|nr:hypothetical protein [Pedobacter sp. MR22-3]MCX2585369.1 hypothetical protein [Pedobacter sp. MR22-3]
MENQNKDQEKSTFFKQAQENPSTGLNDWNDRLDENLEPEKQGDTAADDRAKDFSEKLGSGDQSDQTGN